jgi:hypothetical protein
VVILHADLALRLRVERVEIERVEKPIAPFGVALQGSELAGRAGNVAIVEEVGMRHVRCS